MLAGKSIASAAEARLPMVSELHLGKFMIGLSPPANRIPGKGFKISAVSAEPRRAAISPGRTLGPGRDQCAGEYLGSADPSTAGENPGGSRWHGTLRRDR